MERDNRQFLFAGRGAEADSVPRLVREQRASKRRNPTDRASFGNCLFNADDAVRFDFAVPAAEHNLGPERNFVLIVGNLGDDNRAEEPLKCPDFRILAGGRSATGLVVSFLFDESLKLLLEPFRTAASDVISDARWKAGPGGRDFFRARVIRFAGESFAHESRDAATYGKKLVQQAAAGQRNVAKCRGSAGDEATPL